MVGAMTATMTAVESGAIAVPSTGAGAVGNSVAASGGMGVASVAIEFPAGAE